MADRIIKSDSGNDVVIQNNGGTRKIEVTNSGNIEFVGDLGFTGDTDSKFKLPSAGGIYESDGSTPILTESGGSVTIQNATFNGTIGSSATISTQDYMIAGLSGDQTVSHNSATAIAFVDVSDPNNWFDPSTKKFQPNKAGKYCYSLSYQAFSNGGVNDSIVIYSYVKKNSTTLDTTNFINLAGLDLRSEEFYLIGTTANNIVDMNGTSDYLFCVIYCNSYDTSSFTVTQAVTHFSAFRVGP